ncbi:DnaA/Hda family protein [Bartonella sp. HY329]|uniref:DnaA/Hda family protein n=1 Tax=unclassified Bartonella TaxID=2645622 RepID=UPI0021CA13D8|nr:MULTISPECIES: DnaA/Hda family protein [unclassified Bartonella]UXM96293.1 DnaA/Hda family protein [Bartonella sp. HY329]UXN10617.1 DnaA/Hda family protein [Bartonella sp. HY328]
MNVTPRQLPLALEPEARYSIDDFVVTPANNTAFNLLESWPNWPSPVTVLVGPKGAGKTHLSAVWAAQSYAHEFNSQKIDAAIKAALLGTPILIEDMEPNSFDETALFHLINTIRQTRIENKQSSLLMTSHLRPIDWRVALPDLASRLNAVSLIELSPPDEMLLSAVITKLFADRQLNIDASLIPFIASRIERSLAAAAKFVALTDAMALEEKSRINRSLIANVLTKMEVDS